MSTSAFQASDGGGSAALSKVEAVKLLWAATALLLRPPSRWLVPLAKRLSDLLPSEGPTTAVGWGREAGAQRAPSERRGGETDEDDEEDEDEEDGDQCLGPLELLYVARCSDMLYVSLSEEPPLTGDRGAQGAPLPPGLFGPAGQRVAAAGAQGGDDASPASNSSEGVTARTEERSEGKQQVDGRGAEGASGRSGDDSADHRDEYQVPVAVNHSYLLVLDLVLCMQLSSSPLYQLTPL